MFDLPLRLPGQYFDAETALHYNYFRDYDPSIGRFDQFDPIELDDARNGYAYVRSNPLSLIDPRGLHEFRGGAKPLDGCGPNGEILENFVPDIFPKCCKNHDDCYEDCITKATKEECDRRFCQCMCNSCPRVRGGVALPECIRVAGLYCSFVTEGKKAQDQYDKAREKCCGGK